MRLLPVRAVDIDRIWPRVGDYLDAACLQGTGEVSAEMLRLMCKAQEALLMIVTDAEGEIHCAVVTQMLAQPDGKMACVILACGGIGMGQWIGFLREIESGARRNGAASIRFLGRLGWTRVLPDYAVRQLVYEKDLRH